MSAFPTVDLRLMAYSDILLPRTCSLLLMPSIILPQTSAYASTAS